MKATSRILLTLTIVLALAVNCWATPVTFSPDVLGSSVTASDNAWFGDMKGTLALSATPFTLADGVTQALDFFTLTASGIVITNTYNVTANLAFSTPLIASEGIGGGKFSTFFGIISGGTLSWTDMPKTFTLADGNVITIDFQDGWTINVLNNTAMVHAYVTNNGGGTAVPEPTTLLLFGLGLLGLAGVRRKLKK